MQVALDSGASSKRDDRAMPYFGFLNVNKPSGVTSRWVVDQVQRLVRPAKVGHAGTLDPLATGILVVALGQATRLIEYVQRMPKKYRATFLLGRSSDTQDIEGRVIELAQAPVPSAESIAKAVQMMTGELTQVPPDFSAVKVAGQRAYKLARQGKPVAIAPRKITVYDLQVLAYEYPSLQLEISCSGGTYVRTLGCDLARQCGTEAVMSALERTAIGDFTVAQAIDGKSLSLGTISEAIHSPLVAVPDLPRMEVTGDEENRLARGQHIANRAQFAGGEAVAVSPTGRLIAILAVDVDTARPVRVFPFNESSEPG